MLRRGTSLIKAFLDGVNNSTAKSKTTIEVCNSAIAVRVTAVQAHHSQPEPVITLKHQHRLRSPSIMVIQECHTQPFNHNLTIGTCPHPAQQRASQVASHLPSGPVPAPVAPRRSTPACTGSRGTTTGARVVRLGLGTRCARSRRHCLGTRSA